MSQQVTIDYQGVTIKVKSQCDTAIHSLCKIDKVIKRIEDTANQLETNKIKEYEKYLLDSKKQILNKINILKNTLEKYNDAKQKTISYNSTEYLNFIKFNDQINKESNELNNLVNSLTGSKLAVLDEMVSNELLNIGKKAAQSLLDKINGVIDLSDTMLNKINKIEDISLRELAYNIAKKEDFKELSFEEIIKQAKNEYDGILNKKTNQVIDEYKKDLKSKGLDSSLLNNVNSIDQASQVANKAITDEKIRKETIMIIIKAIKDRGFIVDTKNNLKLDRDKNVCKLVALKASGQKAEFEIQLNGKFMYHFDHYEGQACKKDIDPFLEDLKNIYDIDILHEETNWSNPDKIQTQKYQYINKNKGTN